MTKQTPHRGRSEGEKILGDQLLSCQSLEGYRFRVQSMRGRRLSMLRVTAPAPEEAPEGEGAEK